MLTGHYISGSLYREPYKIKSLHGSSWFWACPTMERYKIGSWWAPLSSEVWNRVIQALKNYIYFDKNTLWLCEHVEWHVCSGILLLQFKYEWNKHFFSTRILLISRNITSSTLYDLGSIFHVGTSANNLSSSELGEEYTITFISSDHHLMRLVNPSLSWAVYLVNFR